MCGIYGYWGFQEEGLLRRMGNALLHRGPDDEGVFCAGRLSMGMRRLAIIDLAGGRQPMLNEDGRVAVVFNGEIYNYRELGAELSQLGHRFVTQSDTEVIVHAYEQWGPDCLHRFNGMFGLAVYDQRQPNRPRLLLARDRAGQKPIYYARLSGRDGPGLIFASEIKAILESRRAPRRVNSAAIDSYLALRYVPSPSTLFADVTVLPAAHRLILDDDGGSGRLTVERYWEVQLHRGGRYQPDEFYHRRFDEVFSSAVELTLRSDVPLGAYLSGGIDSSAVVAAMAQRLPRVNTFSIGFNSGKFDETAQARALAGYYGCDHHEIICRPEDFECLPRAVYHMDRPVGDALILAYYLLARQTARHVKVVLSGEGADELFGGYSFHTVIPLAALYDRLVPAAVTQKVVAPFIDRFPVELLTRLFVYPAALGTRGRARVADFVRHFRARSLNENYVELRSLFTRSERQALYSESFRRTASEDWLRRCNGDEDFDFSSGLATAGLPASPVEPRGKPAGRQAGSASVLDRLLRLQFDDWLPDNLLLRQDKNTMAHSLELRCPFLDHRLIELAFQTPPHLKVRGLTDKFIERAWARRHLPRENVRRPKFAFYLPMEFFNGQAKVRDLIAYTLSPEAVRRRGYFEPAVVSALVEQMRTGEFLPLKQVMALVILELWHLIFIDKQKLW